MLSTITVRRRGGRAEKPTAFTPQGAPHIQRGRCEKSSPPQTVLNLAPNYSAKPRLSIWREGLLFQYAGVSCPLPYARSSRTLTGSIRTVPYCENLIFRILPRFISRLTVGSDTLTLEAFSSRLESEDFGYSPAEPVVFFAPRTGQKMRRFAQWRSRLR